MIPLNAYRWDRTGQAFWYLDSELKLELKELKKSVGVQMRSFE